MFQNPNNSLYVIFEKIKSVNCDSRYCNLVIFIAEFLLDFSVSVEATKAMIERIIQFVESHGHIITFAYLPYVPAISKDPKTKARNVPQVDYTQFLVSLNNFFQILASANTIQQAFSNELVGYNHERNNYKPTSWVGYNSTAPPHLRFSCCHTPHELAIRSNHFFNHVEKVITSFK